MILLHTYVDADDPREKRTWAFLNSRADTFRRCGWTVRHVRCRDDRHLPRGVYEKAVMRVWGRDDILFLERDIVPTVPQILYLMACPEPVCAQRYNTGMPTYVSAYFEDLGHVNLVLDHKPHEVARVATRDASLVSFRPALPIDKYADRWALGLTRIRKTVQQDGAGWDPGPWTDLDGRLSAYLNRSGVRAHLHSPKVQHHHPFDWRAYLPPGVRSILAKDLQPGQRRVLEQLMGRV